MSTSIVPADVFCRVNSELDVRDRLLAQSRKLGEERKKLQVGIEGCHALVTDAVTPAVLAGTLAAGKYYSYEGHLFYIRPKVKEPNRFVAVRLEPVEVI